MLRIVDDSDALAEGVTVAGRYTLERVVGEGGMGVVWAARHVLTHKACALKFLKERRAQDPKSHERLLREARAACAVRHPNVAQVHDLLELPSGAPFIVMDLLDGEPLSRRLERDGPLSPKLVLELLGPTMDAVLAAHAHGIVHRDLKPDNVFLERRGDGALGVKVLDFGIAKQAELVDDVAAHDAAPDLGRSVTSTYSVLGTPKYMAPEQGRAGGKVGFPTDVWALGMMAHECATGELPPSVGTEPEERQATILENLRAAGLADEVAKTIASMLAEAPEDRPELALARERILRPRSARAPRPFRVRREWLVGGGLAIVALAIGSWATRGEHATAREPVATAEPGGSGSSAVPVSASVSASVSVSAAVSAAVPVPVSASVSVSAPVAASAPVSAFASGTAAPAVGRPTPRAQPTVTAPAPSARASAAPIPTPSSSSRQEGIPTRVRD